MTDAPGQPPVEPSDPAVPATPGGGLANTGGGDQSVVLLTVALLVMLLGLGLSLAPRLRRR